MQHRVIFDEKVKRFLYGEMTPSEEQLFKHELLSDWIKIKRAQAILNQIKATRYLFVRPKYKLERIAALKSLIVSYYRDYGDLNEEFDAAVDLFIKNKMTPEEELSFKDLLDSSDQSRERAQFFALTIESMLNEAKEGDQRIIEAIKDTDMNDLISMLNESYVPDSIAAMTAAGYSRDYYSDEDRGEDDKKDGKKDEDDLDIAAWE